MEKSVQPGLNACLGKNIWNHNIEHDMPQLTCKYWFNWTLIRSLFRSSWRSCLWWSKMRLLFIIPERKYPRFYRQSSSSVHLTWTILDIVSWLDFKISVKTAFLPHTCTHSKWFTITFTCSYNSNRKTFVDPIYNLLNVVNDPLSVDNRLVWEWCWPCTQRRELKSWSYETILSEQSHSQVVRDDDEREETEINFNTFRPQHNMRVKWCWLLLTSE